jgi:hypothetical protein
MTVGATLFGGIYIGAWNFVFLTNIALILWRVASLWSTASGVLIISMRVLAGLFGSQKKRLAIVKLLVFLYISARFYLLVETFRTLFFLPPLAYVSTWTANIPHFS